MSILRSTIKSTSECLWLSCGDGAEKKGVWVMGTERSGQGCWWLCSSFLRFFFPLKVPPPAGEQPEFHSQSPLRPRYLQSEQPAQHCVAALAVATEKQVLTLVDGASVRAKSVRKTPGCWTASSIKFYARLPDCHITQDSICPPLEWSKDRGSRLPLDFWSPLNLRTQPMKSNRWPVLFSKLKKNGFDLVKTGDVLMALSSSPAE